MSFKTLLYIGSAISSAIITYVYLKYKKTNKKDKDEKIKFNKSLNPQINILANFLKLIHASTTYNKETAFTTSVGFSFLSLQQILLVCCKGTDNDKLIDSYDRVLVNTNINDHIQFNKMYNDSKVGIICNLLWYSNNLVLNEHFDSDTVMFLDTRCSKNMQDDVNKWISEKTNNNINKIDDIGNSPMIIINVIHFNNVWKIPFLEKNTMEGIFYGSGEQKYTKQFMSIDQIKCLYYKNDETLNDNFKMISLDYENGFNMIFVLSNIYQSLFVSEKELIALYEKMSIQEVNIRIPKFEIETEIDATNILKNIGINIFEHDHNLFFKNRPIQLSKIIQKFKINVNEKGTAMSAVSRTLTLGISNAFVANHTFSFYLMHTDSRTVIASGIVSS